MTTHKHEVFLQTKSILQCVHIGYHIRYDIYLLPLKASAIETQ